MKKKSLKKSKKTKVDYYLIHPSIVLSLALSNLPILRPIKALRAETDISIASRPLISLPEARRIYEANQDFFNLNQD